MSERKDMRVVRLDTFVLEEETIEWLVEGLLPNVGWTLFVGMKGLGKTTFCLQMCAAIVEGTPFLGMNTTQGRILYVQADSVPIEWREIVKRVAPNSKGFTVVNVADNAFANKAYIQRLVTISDAIQPDLLVFDSLYKLKSTNINTDQVSTDINYMHEIAQGKPFVLIHHPPHEQTRAAGSGYLGANCSNEWHLLKQRLDVVKGRLVKTKSLKIVRDDIQDSGLWWLQGTEPGAAKAQALDPDVVKYGVLGAAIRKRNRSLR